MKRNLPALLGMVAFFCVLAAFCAQAQEFPQPRGAVNDFAQVIPSSVEHKIESLCRELWQKTGTALVIATFKDIGDQDPAMFANRLYAAWGIGKKGEDKGVLFFLALKQRRVRIETGYGVEGILPDGLVGQILDQAVVPFFKKGDFGTGFLNGTAVLASIVAKDAGVKLTGVPRVRRPARRSTSRGLALFPLIFIFLVIFFLGRRRGGMWPLLLLFMMGGGRGGFGGGGFGGFGGGFGGFGGGMSGGGGAGRGF